MTKALDYMCFRGATKDDLTTIVRAIDILNKYLPMENNNIENEILKKCTKTIKPISIKRVVRYNNNILTKPEFIFRSQDEAEKVIYGLQELLSWYGFVSVADLYNLIGCESNFIDNKIGWYNLDVVEIMRTYNGYKTTLPMPVEEE